MGFLTEMWVVFGAKTDKLKQGTREAEQTLSGFSNQVSKIGGLIAGAFAVEKITAFAWEATKLAGELQGVGYAFDALNKPGLLKDLREATRGTVSDLDLMKSAVQANNFQIPLEQLASLLKFAHLRAQQTGQSVDYLVQSIVLGIGRKSPLILDNLGISTVALKQRFGEAGAEAASVGEVAKAVGEIAEEAMSKSGTAIETTTSSIARMNASWTNTKTIIGELLTPAVTTLTGILERAAQGWQRILNPGKVSGDMASDEIGRIQESLQGLSKEDALTVLQRELKSVSDASKDLQGKKFFIFSKEYKEAGLQLDAYAKISAWIKEIFYNTDELTKAIEVKNTSTEDGLTLTEEEIAAAKKLQEQYEQLGDKLEKVSNLRAYVAPMPKTETPPEENVVGFGENYIYTPEAKNWKTGIGWDQDNENATVKGFAAMAESARGFGDEMMRIGASSAGLREFANAAKSAAKQFVATQIASGVSSIIAKVFENTKNPWLGLILGPIAGGAAAAIFNQAVPSFSTGGMANGPTLAMVGDNPSGKEMMVPMPWNGVQGLIANQSGGRVEFVLRGQDLYGSYTKYQKHLNNV
jgi:hypothetical protein